MDLLLAAGTVLLLVLACLGLGSTILYLFGIDAGMEMGRRLAWSFSIGSGVLGWVIFFPAATGFLTPPVLTAICLLSTGGLYFPVTRRQPLSRWPEAGGVTWLLLAVLLAILFVDLLEGLSPPADADTLAYHFTLPKRHLAAGGLVAIPRAVDGILPQLVHMTYAAALGLGGEKALTLWTMVSGWATAALLFDLCRRHIGANWSLAIAAVYLSTPAVLQTGGAGYVEPRVAQFVLIAAIAAGLAVNRSNAAYAGLSGLCAGFFAASKYTGLLFCVAAALPLLVGRNRWKHLFWFGLFAAVAAGQWYVWIWLRTGDPVFPMLYGVLGAKPGLWSTAQDALFRATVQADAPFPRSLWWFIAYPFYVTFAAGHVLESGRTGLGVLPILLLPFAVGWLLTGWRHDVRSPLFIAGVIIALSYAVWFFIGTPQRPRHLLPFYPILLACLAVPAVRWATRDGFCRPLAAAFVLCLGIQTAGQAVYGRNYAYHVFSGETRSAFLDRNVWLSSAVSWFNRHRKHGDKLLVFNRELLYLVDPPVLLSHPDLQQRVNFERMAAHPAILFKEMRNTGVTHIMVVDPRTGKPDPGSSAHSTPTAIDAVDRMVKGGCLRAVYRRMFDRVESRTLRKAMDTPYLVSIYRLVGRDCRP